MASSSGCPSTPTLDTAFPASDLHSLGSLLSHRLTHSAFQTWVSAETGRLQALQDMFFGAIRWSKSYGRSMGATLAMGFSIVGQFHTIDPVDEGGHINMNHRWRPLDPVTLWDAPDDDTHHHVNYFGYYRRFSAHVLANKIDVAVAGRWTRPVQVVGPGYLLPNPLGFVFGRFDGTPIFLDEIVLDFHPLLRSAIVLQKLGVLRGS